ncbi:MAG: hypothetical protein IPJ28_10890 [Betaproteobacteria bacterium]|nr:hypothetical protein [Betaproteobacteria bacterium]
MTDDQSHDDPLVVYRAAAILLAAFALALLVMPFDWILGGVKSPGLVLAIAGNVGEFGSRLVFALPCGLLAAWAARKGWGLDA